MIRVIVLALLLLAAPAVAQPAQEQAKQLYDQGTQHYNLAEYDKAIPLYKDAYRTFPNPYFLYNIAQAYRLNGESKQALSFYKSFLNALPDAPNRADVEARIGELEAAIQAQAQASNAAPTAPRLPTPAEAVKQLPRRDQPAPVITALPEAPRADPSAPPLYKRWWFWVGVGVVAAGASTAAVMASGDDGAPSSDLGNFPVFRGGFR